MNLVRAWPSRTFPPERRGPGFSNPNLLPSLELAPLFAFLLFWVPLCFPLTRQNKIYCFAGVPFFQPIVTYLLSHFLSPSTSYFSGRPFYQGNQLGIQGEPENTGGFREKCTLTKVEKWEMPPSWNPPISGPAPSVSRKFVERRRLPARARDRADTLPRQAGTLLGPPVYYSARSHRFFFGGLGSPTKIDKTGRNKKHGANLL